MLLCFEYVCQWGETISVGKGRYASHSLAQNEGMDVLEA